MFGREADGTVTHPLPATMLTSYTQFAVLPPRLECGSPYEYLLLAINCSRFKAQMYI